MKQLEKQIEEKRGKHPNCRNGFKKGCIVWNKGRKGLQKNHNLTGLQVGRGWNKGKKSSEEWKQKLSLAKIGVARKLFTDETRKKMSLATSGEKNPWFGKIPANLNTVGKFGNIKRGWFKIGERTMFFRSTWEANYALYLEWLKKIGHIKDWEYEADVFVFEKIKFGTRSYRPDFKIFNNNGSFYFDEVKGYMDSKSITKIKRMKKYFPNIVLNVIDGKAYNDIKRKVGGMLHFY